MSGDFRESLGMEDVKEILKSIDKKLEPKHMGIVGQIGNGGIWAAAYRVSVWLFLGMAGLIGWFSKDKLDQILSQQSVILASTRSNENKIGLLDGKTQLNNAAIENLRQQITREWLAQEKRDSVQDKNIDRIERDNAR